MGNMLNFCPPNTFVNLDPDTLKFPHVLLYVINMFRVFFFEPNFCE